MRQIPVYLSASADEFSAPDAGRITRLTIGLLPPVPLVRRTILGVDCYVERWPGSILPHPAAERHAHDWLTRAGHREVVL